MKKSRPEEVFILKGFKALAGDSPFVLDIKLICPYTFQIGRNVFPKRELKTFGENRP